MAKDNLKLVRQLAPILVVAAVVLSVTGLAISRRPVRPRRVATPPTFRLVAQMRAGGEPIPQEVSARVQTFNAVPAQDAAYFFVEVHPQDLPRATIREWIVTGIDGAEYSLTREVSPDDSYFMVLTLPRGYSKPIEKPRLLVREGGIVLASWPLRELPRPASALALPVATALNQEAVASVASPISNGLCHITVQMSHPEPQTEYVMRLRRTPAVDYGSEPVIGSSRSRSDPTSTFAVSTASAPSAIEVDIEAYRSIDHTLDVSVQGGRIVSMFGQPEFWVERPITISPADGVSLILPKQIDGPRQAPQKIHDDITIVSRVAGTRIESGVLLKPLPEQLGLKTIYFTVEGSREYQSQTSVRANLKHTPVVTGPVELFVRLHRSTAKRLWERKMVLPVRPFVRRK